VHRWLFVVGRWSVVLLFVVSGSSRTFATSADDLPQLTQPVNDFAHVIDSGSAAQIDRLSRALESATGDTIIVATVPTFAPYGDINEYKVKLFENHGRGIGHKGKDNGLLIVAAMNDRKVGIEVGYDLEQFVPDGYAGETIREFILPAFRQQQYGPGLLAGAQRVAARIAQARGVSIENLPVPQRVRQPGGGGIPFWVIVLIIILFSILGRSGRPRGPRSRYWGGGPWSGWSSGVGPFGGGWSSGGGGFGGGFGGFGGGRSGGGGASGGW
jgi:uncharacterized protein